MIDKKTSTRINCLIYMIRGNCIDWKFSKLPCLRSSFAVPYGYNISNITINFQTVHIIQLLLSTCLFCCCFFCFNWIFAIYLVVCCLRVHIQFNTMFLYLKRRPASKNFSFVQHKHIICNDGREKNGTELKLITLE